MYMQCKYHIMWTLTVLKVKQVQYSPSNKEVRKRALAWQGANIVKRRGEH
jgi:hypothetical protein